MLRVNLLRAHGSPSRYHYGQGCRCEACRGQQAARDAAYYAANREERAAYDVAYRAEHREEAAAYYAANREESAAYRAARREEKAAYDAAYSAAHSEKKASHNASYYAAHREEAATRVRRRRSRKRGNGGTHTATDVRAQYKHQRGRCYYCGVKVGETYHVDHAVPLSKGGSNGPENLVIACPHCNLSKNDKLPHEFAGRLC
jgi:5-methylcytosine-specific restriction endonuclease McrA